MNMNRLKMSVKQRDTVDMHGGGHKGDEREIHSRRDKT